jgi:NAD(P)H-dependent flavin oxidoreductase YrpB (nitropropane dioxygenase family)
LIPTVVELVKGHKSPITGEQVQVVAAGGVYNGRGLAAALCHGASAVWLGTRFVCAKEAGAPQAHKQAIVDANFESVVKSTIFTGRPLHIINSDYIRSWEEQRPDKIKELQSQGIVPVEWDLEQDCADEEEENKKINGVLSHWFAGKVAAVVDKIEPAKDIIDEIVKEAAQALQKSSDLLVPSSKL